MILDITIEKSAVYDEVAQTTSYTGAKMEGGDAETYDRIFTTEDDRSQLDRFWDESCVAVQEALKEFVQGERGEDSFTLHLALSASFEPNLEGAMRKEVFSFFVNSITSKWFVFTNKKEAADFAAMAQGMLEGIRKKAYFRRKPRKPNI